MALGNSPYNSKNIRTYYFETFAYDVFIEIRCGEVKNINTSALSPNMHENQDVLLHNGDQKP